MITNINKINTYVFTPILYAKYWEENEEKVNELLNNGASYIISFKNYLDANNVRDEIIGIYKQFLLYPDVQDFKSQNYICYIDDTFSFENVTEDTLWFYLDNCGYDNNEVIDKFNNYINFDNLSLNKRIIFTKKIYTEDLNIEDISKSNIKKIFHFKTLKYCIYLKLEDINSKLTDLEDYKTKYEIYLKDYKSRYDEYQDTELEPSVIKDIENALKCSIDIFKYEDYNIDSINEDIKKNKDIKKNIIKKQIDYFGTDF